jgi:hypothetical protein
VSEVIRRHDIRAIGGKQIRITVSGDYITAVLQYTGVAEMQRARGKYVKRGWTVVKTSGFTIEIKVKM